MKYKTLSFKDAMDLGFDEEDLKDTFGDYHYRHGIFEMDGQKPIHIIGADGGEPEDQTLERDWKWVMPALNEAFKKGFESALNKVENKIGLNGEF